MMNELLLDTYCLKTLTNDMCRLLVLHTCIHRIFGLLPKSVVAPTKLLNEFSSITEMYQALNQWVYVFLVDMCVILMFEFTWSNQIQRAFVSLSTDTYHEMSPSSTRLNMNVSAQWSNV